MWRDRYMHYCLWTLCLRMFEERLLWWHCMQSSVSCSHCCSHFRLSGNADVITPDLLHGVLKVCSMVFFFPTPCLCISLFACCLTSCFFSIALSCTHARPGSVGVGLDESSVAHLIVAWPYLGSRGNVCSCSGVLNRENGNAERWFSTLFSFQSEDL